MRAGVVNVLWVLMIFLSCAKVSRAQHENPPCGAKLERERRERELRANVRNVISIIRTKNGPGLLKYIDDSGFYVWGGLLSREEIRKEIGRKDGIYCLFFSTDCLASAKLPNGAYVNSSKWKISYSEWLARHGTTTVDLEMFYGGEENPCHANVSIRSEQISSSDEATFELGFDFRSGFWKLASTPAWPEGIASIFPSVEINKEQTEATTWRP